MAKARIGAGFLEVGLLQLLKLTGQRQSGKTSIEAKLLARSRGA